jgi:hypothetical protein
VRGRPGRRMLLFRPSGADGEPLPEAEAQALYAPLPPHVELHAGPSLPGSSAALKAWLAL